MNPWTAALATYALTVGIALLIAGAIRVMAWAASKLGDQEPSADADSAAATAALTDEHVRIAIALAAIHALRR
ncbi:MAG TPA: hypothetical protein P5555_03415 [Candidatus Paceibacterota bacterium]|nr:hypothetical protein [Verrucomicrobiota bacterium]HOX01482.1 hypothetical protein [Verrucomicrobiota bacterium]HRZ44220.1 hypothetical protein [Candidatus Paceibacterota bacterium]HRZ92457.1 hypothetical protein [Candidatus Paceibacterota bacterium]